jgi:HlyD family secretion protein
LERDLARLSGERAQYIASRAQAKGKITETELQIIQVDKDVSARFQGPARDQRQDQEFVERKRRKINCAIDIRAPQDGVVLQSTVHTAGGVITAGDAIMMVPWADDLSVVARSIRRTSTSCRSARRRAAAVAPTSAPHRNSTAW